MKKKDLRLLERIFEAEISGRLPFQSRAVGYKQLAEQGMVEYVEQTLAGRFPVIITGWVLTDLGRLKYCESCSSFDETKP